MGEYVVEFTEYTACASDKFQRTLSIVILILLDTAYVMYLTCQEDTSTRFMYFDYICWWILFAEQQQDFVVPALMIEAGEWY